MKTKLQFTFIAALVLLAGRGFAQGTAFTYQGRLDDGGAPADGIYDLRFAIYDGATGGSVVAGPMINAATAVSGGLFTTTLDFGAGVFNGASRWLEIGVRTNGSPDDFIALAPRQPLTATPYAVRAASANSFTGAVSNAQLPANIARLDADQSFSGANTLNHPDNRFTGNGAGLTELNASRLSSGTLADARLSANIARLDANQTFSGVLDLRNAANSYSGSGAGLTSLNASELDTGTVADARLSSNAARRAGGNAFTGSQTVTGGSVGIGTSSPGAPLHVVGGSSFPHLKVAAGSASPYGAILGLDATATAGGKDYLIFSGGGTANQGKLVIQNLTDALNILTLNPNGDVGVGTTSPANKFSVAGNANFTGNVGIGTSSPGAPLHVVGGNAFPHLKLAAAPTAPFGAFLSLDATATAGGKDYLIFATGGSASEGTGKLVIKNATDDEVILTLTSNGHLGVGTTSAPDTLTVEGSASFEGRVLADSSLIVRRSAVLNIPTAYFADENNNPQVEIGTRTGYALRVYGLAVRNDGNPFWDVPSDRRLKTDIRPLNNALTVIERVRPVGFHWSAKRQERESGLSKAEQFSVIAQEFAEVFPSFVSTNADGYLTVNPSPLMFFNTAAIRELHQRVKEKDGELSALKSANAQLEQRLAKLETLVTTLLTPARQQAAKTAAALEK
jgi:hypothetical protein